MEIYDDFPSFSSPEKSSPEPQKKFKRLKKRRSPLPPDRSIRVDSAEEEDAAAKTLDAILNEDDSIDAADEALDAILNEDDSIDAADKSLEAILNEDDSIDADDKTLDAILNEDDDDDTNYAADKSLDEILNEDDDSNDAADKSLNAILNEDTNDSFPSRLESLLDTDDSNGPAEMPLLSEDRKATKRALDFSDEGDSVIGGDSGRTEKKRSSEEDSEKEGSEKEDAGSNKKKNKRVKSAIGSDEKKCKPAASDKRRQEKERKEHLKQLHAESQRLLRETTEAAFKPIPAVKKPISSVLEKIRQRKLELSKRKAPLDGNALVTENSVNFEDDTVGSESRSESIEHKKGRKTKPLEEVFSAYPENLVGRSVVETDSLSEPASPSSNEVLVDKKSPSEASVPMFRAPINDTEDIFANSETQDGIEELPGDLQDSPSDGVRGTPVLSMNLKLDSDPDEDSSSEEEEEEEDDKENINPHLQLHRSGNDSTSLRGAPVEAFLDNEAEEEDDSDDELLGLNKNEEEEDIGDLEELNDIIATNYTEKPVDHDRRNELHQKWLEQQDAAGTDNLLQKFKIGSASNEDIEFVEEREVSEDEEDSQHEDVVMKMSARMASKRAKEMIVKMFVDKDDGFVSDEDEEIEKHRVKQQLLIRAEEQATLISPMEDESSREMFGLIKKLNIAPENKKKAKPTSYFDSVLKGGNSNSFPKPSFLRRASSQNLPSSRKKGLGTVKSFIFGRDDSNSRSSISISEDSLDAMPKENQTTTTTTTNRTSTALFSSSQAKFSSQYKSTATAQASSASLFEILKRASTSSTKCDNDRVDLSNVLSTFKVPQKQIKVVGRR